MNVKGRSPQAILQALDMPFKTVNTVRTYWGVIVKKAFICCYI